MCCCYMHAKGKTCHMKLGRQLTGHIDYFIYPSLTGTKKKKPSPIAFYCIYLGIYYTLFTVRSELLC